MIREEVLIVVGQWHNCVNFKDIPLIKRQRQRQRQRDVLVVGQWHKGTVSTFQTKHSLQCENMIH